VHGYWSIDFDILHTTASDDLPGFADQLRDVLGNLDDDVAPGGAPGEDESSPPDLST
jgi:hypothetical protein